MRTTNGALRSVRTLRPLPLVKKVMRVTRALLRPLGFLTETLTRSRPPAGVQRRPVSRLSSPSAAGAGADVGVGVGAAAGGGTATGPVSRQTPQPEDDDH